VGKTIAMLDGQFDVPAPAQPAVGYSVVVQPELVAAAQRSLKRA
jgi:hypothetical protein